MPHLRVLGTAQDGGFPHAACDCVRCQAAARGAVPRRYVASLALVLPARQERYLVDATPDVREQLAGLAAQAPARGGVDRRPVDGILLTHAHIGHYLGLAFFGFEAVSSQNLPVFGSPAMIAFLNANAPWQQLVRQRNIRAIAVDPGTPLRFGDVEVVALRVPHRDEYADTVAYRFRGPRRTVLYLPDTDPWRRWTGSVDDVTGGADVLLLDATFASEDELPGRSIEQIGHPLVSETMARWADAVAAKRVEVWLTHFNHSNPILDPDGRVRREVEAEGFGVLDDGAIIEL